MNEASKAPDFPHEGDQILREVWRAKDALSAAYGHDLDRMFDEARERQKLSGHRIVSSPEEVAAEKI